MGRADEDLGTVAVQQTTPVTGRIVVPEPLPSGLDLKRLTVMLRALDGPANVNIFTTARLNDDGTFTLPNVVAGRYRIAIAGLPPDSYFISARAEGREVLDVGYSVSGEQRPLELRIGGPGSVGVVEGAVVNARGEPVPSSTVVLVPAGDRRTNPSAFRSTSSDQQGNFSIRSVLAGEYKILAWEEIEPGAYVDPEFLKDFETRGEILRVQRDSQNSLTVRLIPASSRTKE
jgi:hypothetical protein